jgi:hypothetical protein
MTTPIKCKTQQEIIVATLWQHGGWVATHGLMSVETPYGFIGSAGHVRARELARNDCPEKLRNKVERARGGVIGLDARYEFFRYKQCMTRAVVMEQNRHALEFFESYPPNA